MTEDAQAAFLKTLEEPPAGTVLILTAADEERLLPTIRSRCVRIRLGPVARHDVESILVDAGLAEAPLAARLARLAAGRPGDAVALARAPESLVIRSEVGRTLIDLIAATRADRLRIARDLLARARPGAAAQAGATRRPVAGRSPAPRPGVAADAAPPPLALPALPAHRTTGGRRRGAAAAGSRTRRSPVPAAERRAAALALVTIWRDVARDLALVGLGEAGEIGRSTCSTTWRPQQDGSATASPWISSGGSSSPASDSRATSARSSSSTGSRSAGPRDRARLEAVVHGRVQGVGFRIVRTPPREPRVAGWVANEPAGACGASPRAARCSGVAPRGPARWPAGRPGGGVEVAWRPATGEFAAFDVRSGWHRGD